MTIFRAIESKLLILMVLLTTILSACGGGGDSDGGEIERTSTTVITGRVLDASTSRPVASAQVWTNPSSSVVFTNDQGNFSIDEGVTETTQQYTVYATASGYSANNSIVSANSTGFTTADILLNNTKTGLSTAPDTLRFSENEDSKTFYLSTDLNNSNFSVEPTVAWLDATPTSGTIVNAAGENKVITVTVDRTNLEIGNYTGELAINSSNVMGTTISVTMAVDTELPPIIGDPAGPQANDDTASLNAGANTSISPLNNDSGDSIQLLNITQPTKGTATVSGNTISYTANSNATGTDSITYTIGDANGQQASASIVITINSGSVPFGDPETTNGFTLTPGTCSVNGTDMTCEFKVTSDDANSDLYFRGGGYGDQTRINIDGDETIATYVALGSDTNNSQYFGASASLTKGIPVNGSVKFKDIDSEANNIDLMHFFFQPNANGAGDGFFFIYYDAIVSQ